ncbi:transcriptional regulator, GntR family [Streptomyces sp. DvalAA-14]|uniref:aminotransferase class I/II-fold pyridoxal phosphate-dependent enzyme n=1 Tax=unclassified Streptomyces TaxID=2593676 RepID=UPI00081B3A5A|nr:aminotransferase class I/II-fold pyridoxal phosphate-dependent enzyme [Streptomyces sp. DvalAA-14]MYS19147.1 aminotransferase class I/II-fold pyridoxal phosphate-dependent enzyme [Streptomyces sp. SID4948]SCD37849.1 transcriptional regulator, GntR family [Streptomyces sp. DvalAA-14]
MLGEYRITGSGASAIAADIEGAVGSGALGPGDALPPLRDLARELDVNPNTVAAAYRLLRDRGVIETAGRRGSRIRSRPATAARDEIRIDVPPGARDLSTGNPDPALLPPLAEALAEAAAHHARTPALYGGPPVDAELARLARAGLDADGVPGGPIGVTSGSLDAIERVLAAHLRAGDAVAVEDPGWGSLLDLVPAMGLRAVPVAVDDDGPVAAAVARALQAGVRALVVTDRGQNPTGAALSGARATELRRLLAAHRHVLVIDDDHVHGLVDLPLHCLSGATDHWALIRSTAKAYGPDLRLALCTGDAVTVDRVRGRHRLGAGWVSHLLQRTVVHLWQSGAVDPAATARAYGDRREALLGALGARGVTAHGRSGMNVWVPVPDETGAVAGLLQRGWAVAPGARFRLGSAPGVRLTVSPLAPADIEPLADAVAAVLRPAGAGRYG